MTDDRALLKKGYKKWPQGRINPQDDSLTSADVSDYVRFKTIEYRTADLQDDNLWEAFNDDFSGFTVEAFKNCYLSDIRRLRLLLRANGVWVLKDTHVTIAQSMHNTLTEQIQSEWPEADVKQYLDSGKKFNSARMQYLVRGVVGITQASSRLIPSETPQSPYSQDPFFRPNTVRSLITIPEKPSDNKNASTDRDLKLPRNAINAPKTVENSPPASPTQEQPGLFLIPTKIMPDKGTTVMAKDLANQSLSHTITASDPTTTPEDDPTTVPPAQGQDKLSLTSHYDRATDVTQNLTDRPPAHTVPGVASTCETPLVNESANDKGKPSCVPHNPIPGPQFKTDSLEHSGRVEPTDCEKKFPCKPRKENEGHGEDEQGNNHGNGNNHET